MKGSMAKKSAKSAKSAKAPKPTPDINALARQVASLRRSDKSHLGLILIMADRIAALEARANALEKHVFPALHAETEPAGS